MILTKYEYVSSLQEKCIKIPIEDLSFDIFELNSSLTFISFYAEVVIYYCQNKALNVFLVHI